MKDIVISQTIIKREFLILSICFAAAVLFNVYAIASRGTQWSELFTQLHITLGLAIVFYVMLGLVRLILFGVRALVGRGR